MAAKKPANRKPTVSELSLPDPDEAASLNLRQARSDYEVPVRTGDEILSAYKTPIEVIEICLDWRLGAAKQEAAAALKVAYENVIRFPTSDRALSAYDEAVDDYESAAAAAAAASARFEMRALPRPEYDALCALPEHRPTVTHQKAHKAKCEQEGLPYAPLSFNPDTFPPALIAQCSVTPDLTREQADRIWVEWSDGQTGVLFDFARRIQRIVY